MISSPSIEKIFSIVSAIFILLALSPLDSASNMEAYEAGERNREAWESYVGPVLGPIGGAARFYSVVNCESKDCPRFPKIQMQKASKEKSGFAAVQEIFAKDKQTTVTQGPNGLIRMEFGAEPSELLKTRIHYLKFTKRERYNIISAEGAIESSKEVKDAIQRCRLDAPVIVISELIQDPMPGVPHLPDHIKDMTLDQALDLLAMTFGEVILYEECIRPNGTRCFIINQDYTQGGKWFDELRARWDKLREQGFKTGVCPVHHVPLQKSPVYGWSHYMNDAPADPRPEYPDDEHFQREEKYPMRLSVNERLAPSRDFQKKHTPSAEFCPECQKLFEDDLRYFSSKQTRKASH